MTTKHILINGDSRNMSHIQDESVQLIVTSPPYWQLKDYGVNSQIGFNDTYEAYINNLNFGGRNVIVHLLPVAVYVSILEINLPELPIMADTKSYLSILRLFVFVSQ